MDAYLILELTPSATKADIKRAYRRLARRYHPDKNPGPEAEEKFKVVKEAYQYLTYGRSASHLFDRIDLPVPPPPKPSTVWSAPTGAMNAPHVTVELTFSEAFTGGIIKVPSWPFTISYPAGIQHGVKHRMVGLNWQTGERRFFDVEFRLYDPQDFFKLQTIDGTVRFCCHVKVTILQMLGGFEHSIRNVDPNVSSLVFSFDLGDRVKILPRQGMKLENGTRSDLYAIPVIEMVPISRESYPVLLQVNKLISEKLNKQRR